MINWEKIREINAEIDRCRRGGGAVLCLTALFEKERDGHVAVALGEECERLGRVEEARHWFSEANRLNPVAEYRARALEKLRRLGSSVHRASTQAQLADDSVLHVIECSKRKIWDLNVPTTSRFVPAKQAYLGDVITSWLADPRASHDRWLILSARYGFVDPDQPIENYDVTFNLPSTGPITDDALAAQVRGQVRWPDAVPIRHFKRVVVHGHDDYFDRVCSAFRAVGAHVIRDGEPVRAPQGRATTPSGNVPPLLRSV